MATMYEKIMMIPIFTGLSHDQISNILEKTSISFSQYQEGEYICKNDDPVNTLICILDGEISVEHRIGNNNSFYIEEIIDKPISINSTRLFGIERTSATSVKALRKTGVMAFEKKDFFKLLLSNEIIEFNFLNSLSYRSQTAESIFKLYPTHSIQYFINSLLKIYTSRVAKTIKLHFNIAELSSFTGIDAEEIEKEFILLSNSTNINRIPTGIEIINEFL